MANLGNLEVQMKIGWDNLPYEKSLEILRERGFERHMHHDEYVEAFLNDYFFSMGMGKYAQRDNFRRIISAVPKFWLGMAMMREGSKLHIAIDPQNLKLNNAENIYETTNNEELVCLRMETFEVGKHDILFYDIARRLDELPESLVEFLYQSSHNDIEKNHAIHNTICIPPSHKDYGTFWWPYSGCSDCISFSPGIKSDSYGVAQKTQEIEVREIKVLGDILTNANPKHNYLEMAKGGNQIRSKF